MKIILIVLIVIVAGVILSRIGDKNRAKKLESIFRGREQLNNDSFYDTFFKSQGISKDVAVGVREVMETVLDADLTRLSSSDDFTKNLTYFWEYDSLADVELVTALEKRFNIKINDQEAGRAKTVNDLVRLINSKVRS